VEAKREEKAMMFWYGHGMSGWGYTLMTIGTVLFWGLLVAGVILLARYLARGPQAVENADPERILAERFARGEIDEEDYRGRLATLRGDTRTQV
jgi:putative membrane protein